MSEKAKASAQRPSDLWPPYKLSSKGQPALDGGSPDGDIEPAERARAALISAIPGATFRMDRQGTYLEYIPGDGFEPAAPPETFLGKRVDEILPLHVAERALEHIRLSLETGRVQQFEYDLEANGETRHFEARIAPDQQNSVFAVVRDDTQRIRAARALEESEARYRALYENIPLMYFTLSTDGTVRTVNSVGAEQLGYTQEELVGQPVLTVFHRDDRKAVQRQLANAVRKPGHVARWEFRKVKKDGTIIWVRESVTTVKSHDGQVVVLVVCEDVTERKATEQQLSEHREQLEQLSSELVIAEERERRKVARELHDGVGQLLGLLRGKLARWQAGGGSDEEHTEVCSLLDHAIAQMRSLTVELSSPVLQELGLGAALETLGERMAKEGHFDVQVDCDERAEPVSEELGFVLFRSARELLTNVVKHAHAKNVWISLTSSRGEVTLRVRDDGRGFDTYSPSSHFSNTGSFGLFSIRQQVAHYRGKFDILSEEGKGTTAIVLVPVVPLSASSPVGGSQ